MGEPDGAANPGSAGGDRGRLPNAGGFFREPKEGDGRYRDYTVLRRPGVRWRVRRGVMTLLGASGYYIGF